MLLNEPSEMALSRARVAGITHVSTERLTRFALLSVAILTVGAATPQAGSPQRGARRIMGTFCEIQAHHPDTATGERAIKDALDEMERVDRLLSNYDAASELSGMNREAGRAPFRASPELYDFVRRCRDLVTATGGAFDPTVGPLVRAWGFLTPRPAKPSPQEIAAAARVSGFDKVRLDDAEQIVSFTLPGVEIDPGGIGKGYAVDRAVMVLRRAGVTSALVSAGGSTLYGIGHPPGRPSWRVAVSDPSDREHPVRFAQLRDAALSTSGVSEKFVVVDGRRYSHLFDPRTGMPVEGMCQASVVAPSATDSDALTKAPIVLSREDTLRLFEGEKSVHVLRLEGACGPGRVVWTTPWSTTVFVGPDASPTPGP